MEHSELSVIVRVNLQLYWYTFTMAWIQGRGSDYREFTGVGANSICGSGSSGNGNGAGVFHCSGVHFIHHIYCKVADHLT